MANRPNGPGRSASSSRWQGWRLRIAVTGNGERPRTRCWLSSSDGGCGTCRTQRCPNHVSAEKTPCCRPSSPRMSTSRSPPTNVPASRTLGVRSEDGDRLARRVRRHRRVGALIGGRDDVEVAAIAHPVAPVARDDLGSRPFASLIALVRGDKPVLASPARPDGVAGPLASSRGQTRVAAGAAGQPCGALMTIAACRSPSTRRRATSLSLRLLARA